MARYVARYVVQDMARYSLDTILCMARYGNEQFPKFPSFVDLAMLNRKNGNEAASDFSKSWSYRNAVCEPTAAYNNQHQHPAQNFALTRELLPTARQGATKRNGANTGSKALVTFANR